MNDQQYPDFVIETGYGTVTGLLGVNCRHSFSPFFPGISEPRYTDQQLKELNERNSATKPYPFRNRRGEEYIKNMTYRDQLDHQRYMERRMRNTRSKAAAFKAAGLDDAYRSQRIRYRLQRQEYIKFSDTMNIDQNWERVYMDGAGRIG